MSLSNYNETRYIKRKKNSFSSPLEFMVPRLFFAMNLPRTMTETILYMKVKLIWLPSLPGAQRRDDQRKKTMQPSQLFPDGNQNELYRRQKVTEELSTVTAGPDPK